MFLGRAFVTCYKAEGEVVGWAVPLEARSSLSLALMEIIYVIILHIISNLKIWRWGYITYPFWVSEFVCRILQQLLAQFFNSHWHDCLTVKIIFFSALTRFFNSDIDCWRIVPCTRNKTHDPINALNYWNYRKKLHCKL